MTTCKGRIASPVFSNSTAYRTYYNQRAIKYQPFQHKPQIKNKLQDSKSAPSFDRQALSTIYPHIGIIRANWYSNGSLQTYIYGSGFLVGKNLLITCTHNFFSTYRKRFADQLLFLPNFQSGKVKYRYPRMRKAVGISKIKNGYFENLYSKADADPIEDSSRFKMQVLPTKYQISLVALVEQNEFESQQQNKGKCKGLAIGCLGEQDLNQQLKVMIVGYPSKKYQGFINFQEAEVERCELQGRFHSAQYCVYESVGQQQSQKQRELFNRLEIINYTSETSPGVSGSPILAFKNGQCIVIGIHTHRGRSNDYNSGIYFNSDFLKLIKEFEQSLREKMIKQEYFLGDEKIRIIDHTVKPEIKSQDIISEEEELQGEEEEEQGQKEYWSYSNQSQMQDICDSSKSQANSEMQDFDLLKYFTVSVRDGDEKTLNQSHSCRPSDYDPRLFFSQIIDQVPLEWSGMRGEEITIGLSQFQ